MRLSELNPRWVAEMNAPDDAKQGVSFNCPHCVQIQRPLPVRCAIFFDVPICGRPPVDLNSVHRSQADPGHLADHHIGAVLWHREGDTFENLTLTPSIDMSKWGCWHGFLTNGEIH
jgi:hypothetical protein